MLKQLWKDEAGFVVSAELVLVATILVIGMIAGLSEVQHAVVQELNDVGEAIGSLNQSYYYSGFRSEKQAGGLKAFSSGSSFGDYFDHCDGNQCDLACAPAGPEGPKP